MPTEVETMRDLARTFWAGGETFCPKHAGSRLTGSFVQTTFSDHIFLTCERGKETITIRQRPTQIEFNAQQVEGMVENLQRGDRNLCFRCQSDVEAVKEEDARTGYGDYTFTCVRCYSWGTWSGLPTEAKIGSAPTSGTRKKSSGNVEV